MNPSDYPHDPRCSGPQRDRQNQLRIVLWGLLWAIAFLTTTLAISKKWLSTEWMIAAVAATSLLGLATLGRYRRFLVETDELRRKIEVDALALATGFGLVAGLAYWLLVVAGAASVAGFACVFAGMLIVHSIGVMMGRRRFS